MDRRRCLVWAVLGAGLVFCWQSLTVHVNYGGNWTALYCTGAQLGVPATLASEDIYQFRRSYGYDGQMYHYIAHDPLIRNPDLKSRVDAPRLRYRRILLPGLAYLLAGAQSNWVDPAYFALVLIFTAAGVYWTAACSAARGCSPAWGLCFVLLPAALVSMDRMVVDVVLAALAAGFAFHVRAPSWRLFVILAAAALARETGFLLPAAWCGYLVLTRRPRQAALFSLAAVPALAWYSYVHVHTAPVPLGISLIPFSAIWVNWLHPAVYPDGMRLAWIARFGDKLALAGILTAFALALYWNVRRALDPVGLAALGFVAMGLILQKTDHWTNVYDFGRIYTPVLLFLGMQSLQRRSWAVLVPMTMIWLRIGMQLWSQILGVLGVANNA